MIFYPDLNFSLGLINLVIKQFFYTKYRESQIIMGYLEFMTGNIQYFVTFFLVNKISFYHCNVSNTYQPVDISPQHSLQFILRDGQNNKEK